MLKVIARELTATHYRMLRPIVMYNRKKNWPVHEAKGIQLINGGKSTLGFIKNDMDVNQNLSSVVSAINLQKSKGNYVHDVDGNIMLDVAGTELNPLGYNHDLFKSFIAGQESDASIINNFASDGYSSASFAALVQKVL